MAVEVYRADELTQQGQGVLDAARRGEARIRDEEGHSFLLLPEQRVETLRRIAQTAGNLARLLAGLPQRDVAGVPQDYGEWTWLRSLDADDLQTFLEEMLQALIAGVEGESATALEQTVAEWRTTAGQLDDPTRRAVLLKPQAASEFVEVKRPEITERLGA